MRAMSAASKPVLMALFALVLAIGFGWAPALAGSCADGATCEFTLSNSNTSNVPSGDVIVVWDNTGSGTTFTVYWDGSPAVGLDEFALNIAATLTGSPDTWSTSSNQQVDGFGKFVTDLTCAGCTHGTSLGDAVTFSSATTITNIPDNGNGAEFVAHVRFGGGCSGFFSDGTANSTSTNPDCGAVPEPATLFLLGTGIVGAGLLGRRWFRSR